MTTTFIVCVLATLFGLTQCVKAINSPSLTRGYLGWVGLRVCVVALGIQVVGLLAVLS